MKRRTVKQLVQAMEVTEGAGVTVHRTIGTPALRNLDPFLMLDHFGSNNPDEYIAGFPNHPHRGFVTLTYMLAGHMQHKDSMGNQGDLQPGAAQWMKAASGVIHSEMPQQASGLMAGFQLWINLPASEKMSEPAYQEFRAAAIPEIRSDGKTVRLLLGEYEGLQSPITDPHTQVLYLDVNLSAGQEFIQPLVSNFQGFVYVFEGNAKLAETALPQHSFAVLSEGDELSIASGDQGARFILVAGKTIGEPIVQYGPFVMNTSDEIHQAFEDFRNGCLVKQKASFTSA